MKRTSNRSARPHLLQVSYFSIHPSPPLPPSLSLSHTHSHTFQLSLRKAVNVSMLRSPWSKFPGAYHHGRLLSSGMVTTGHQPDYISWVTLTSSKATGSRSGILMLTSYSNPLCFKTKQNLDPITNLSGYHIHTGLSPTFPHLFQKRLHISNKN